MQEPATTLTDLALALQCLVFAYILAKREGTASKRRDWTLFFAAVALAALLGGVVHGIGFESDSRIGGLLWRAVLVLIGLSALAGWRIGASLTLSGPAERVVRAMAAVLFGAYCLVVLFVYPKFSIAVANYLPAMVFTLVCLILAARSRGSRPLAVAAAGLMISLFAAALQQREIGIHPVYFDHNALYHVIQMVAFALLFVGSLEETRSQATAPSSG